ncbi:MAG: LamB/YcsF family protein [Propionibacteriaceae bacterium]|nr:LamB/YcsF family protein [Propionibacteriaceae bacterium]
MRIDLNADLGESDGPWSTGDDAALLEVVTSASVACGFHAGDPRTMARTVALAVERGVSVGAHISYRDREGFGRRFIDVPPNELHAETTYQLGALAAACKAAGTRLAYVKPHGALYHAICTNPGQAEAVVAAVAGFDPGLALLGLPETLATRLAAAAGLTTVAEAFADRAYLADGGLVPRTSEGAVLTDPEAVAERMLGLVSTGTVQAVDGSSVAIPAQSICVHGDSPGAVAMARAVRARLEDAGVTLAPFA